MQKTIPNVILSDPADGEALRATVKAPPVTVEPGERPDMCEMTVAHAIRDFCKLVFLVVKKEVHWNYHSDLKTSDRILRSCRKAITTRKDLVLDEADFDWVTKKLEEHGGAVFGANTAVVREALVEQPKAEQPKPAEAK